MADEIEAVFDKDRLIKALIENQRPRMTRVSRFDRSICNVDFCHFRRKRNRDCAVTGANLRRLRPFLDGYLYGSDAANRREGRDLPRYPCPKGTRVYIAHIEGTPIEDMVATAKRIAAEGFPVMPHFPARIIKDKPQRLKTGSPCYQGEAGVEAGAAALPGASTQPHGDFHSSMQLMETGLFDGFDRLHVAGHPEGNRDIDPDGSDRNVMDALRWKQAFKERTDARMAMATQFCFEAKPVIKWVERLQAEASTCPSISASRGRQSCRP